jgi:hypothetical protein
MDSFLLTNSEGLLDLEVWVEVVFSLGLDEHLHVVLNEVVLEDCEH